MFDEPAPTPQANDVPARPDVPPAESPPPGTPSASHRRRPRVASALLVALALFATGVGAGWFVGHDSSTARTPASATAPIRLAPPSSPSTQDAGSLDAQAIARKVSPAIVDIYTVSKANPFSEASGPSGSAAGTGMILTSSGQVLTNNHVIAGSSSIRVTIQGRAGTYPATVLGADPSADVALIQVSGVSGLPTVTLADSSSISVGDQVVALGNALGRGGAPSIAEGTVTGLDRSITVADDQGGAERLTHMIQTNAPIQPGDSGGPLVNGSGQVIGMITAGTRTNGFSPTLAAGFAIPTKTAANTVNRVRAGKGGGTLVIGQPGYAGIQVRDLDAATAAQLGLSVRSGALVVGVVAGTPADRAGISQGAVITAIDGRPIRTAEALGPAIRSHHPGSTIRVTWVDGSGTHAATLTLVAGPAV
jgi:S1-C subfamily serine protease